MRSTLARLSSRVTASARPMLSKLVTSELENASGSGELWTELLELARKPGIVNLGQGFPDYEGSSVARRAAGEAMTSPELTMLNQYSLPSGLNDLRNAICEYYNRGLDGRGPGATGLEPANVLVTAGATEALYIAVAAIAGPGDEVVIVFDPCFPWYCPVVRMANATPKLVELKAPHFAPDIAAIEAAITPATKAILVNTPHNPCGHCLTAAELAGLAALAARHDLAVISDEVYENVTFGTVRHLRIADAPGMFERTVTLCSASKLFSLTGWRVGWALAPAAIIRGLGVLHGAATYCAPTPLQHGIARALAVEDGAFEGVPATIEENARVLAAALAARGFAVAVPDGGHFLVAD
ncbi:unnamed protein product, partial [Phaeothamnion confervicola]